MDYVISNTGKNVFIRLNEIGRPETCVKQQAQKFELQKARNILDNLPKRLKQLRFTVNHVSGGTICNEKMLISKDVKTISNPGYKIPESVNEWLSRVSSCNELAKDALARKEELLRLKASADRKFSNKIHEIELEKHKNACAGYKEYDELKFILKKRRIIKDELTIVSLILSCNLKSVATDEIQKAVEGLDKRVFALRETEDFDKMFE